MLKPLEPLFQWLFGYEEAMLLPLLLCQPYTRLCTRVDNWIAGSG